MTYPYRSICVFCGSADGLAPEYYQAAYDTGRLLAEKGITLVYGAGRTGMMGALTEGALAAGGRVIGVVPNGLESPQLIYTTGLTQLEVVPDIQVRKARMNALAEAFICLPGGYGTLDELFEVLTLVQTGKVRRLPIVLVGAGFWRRAIDFEFLVAEGFIDVEDAALFSIVETAEEIVNVLHAFYGGKPPAADAKVE